MVGIAGSISHKEKVAFRQLLIFDSVRGPHSTGVAAVIAKTNNVHLYKSVGDPYQFFYSNDKFSDGSGIYTGDPKLLMGHNRFATVGDVTPSNAHPFRIGKITGAHNGTLTPYHIDKLEDADKFEVDSEAIFNTLDKVGVEETFKRIHGAWALTWYNKEDQKLYITRNNERPLFGCWSKDNKTLFWSSEANILELVLNRNALAYEPLFSFKVNKLYTLDLSKDGNIEKMEVEENPGEYKGFQYPVYAAPISAHTGGTNVGGNSYKNSNVSPFRTQYSKPLKDYLGKKIDFYFGKVCQSENNTDYIKGYMLNVASPPDIRVYSSGNKRHEEWVKGHKDYSGIVKKIAYDNKGNPYLLIDLRSINYGTDPNDGFFTNGVTTSPKEESATGYNGVKLTQTQYNDTLSNGCCWCAADIPWSDRDKIVWMDDDQALGTCCANDPARLKDVEIMFPVKGS